MIWEFEQSIRRNLADCHTGTVPLPSSEMSLQHDAMRLAELVRAVVEGNVEELAASAGAYIARRKHLQARLLDESAASVADADVAQVLRKISTGDGLPSDKVIERLWAQIGESNEFHEFDEQEIEQLGSKLFYSWFSHHEYITGLAELRPLILRAPISESVSRLVRQVKDCYAFQQYDAAYVLCRIVIEASIRDICVRRQLFPDREDNVILFAKFNWGELRDKVSWGPVRERLQNLFSDLCTVIHGRKTAIARDEARKAFEETLQVIELLYAEHGL